MSRSILFLLLFTLGVSSSHAKIFRVGFVGKQVAGVDFTNFDAAVLDAATAGDTIQFYQNSSFSSNVNITKRLVFLGFGFMVEKNPGLQATSANSRNTLFFDSSSAGSIVQGLNINQLFIAADNITISRSYIGDRIYLGYNSISGKQRVVYNVSFLGNFIADGITDYLSYNTAIISNNIFAGGQINLDNTSGMFSNNIVIPGYIYNNTYLNSLIVKNNIFSTYYCPYGASFQNNLLSGVGCTSLPGSGNKFNVNMADVFVNWNNGSISADNQLALKAGSPAIGFGLKDDGTATDAGVFGGDAGFVYRLSGIPSIPSIYQLTAPSQNATTNPYTITVSVRSNN